MSNVIQLRGKPSCERGSATSPPSNLVTAETIDRATRMCSVERSRLEAMLSLLDQSFANIRQLNAMIVDPNVRAVLDAQLAALENALSGARSHARKF